MGRTCHLCCLCSKLMFVKRSRVSKSTYAHQTSQKKACIRSRDTNNSTQSLTRMYHHTATESLYHLHGAKIRWTPTLVEVSYRFGFICFSICLQCTICRSYVFFYFLSHEVTHHKVRKLMDPSFWKKFQMSLAWRA